MKSEIEKIEKRPIQYWYEDGLNELAFGAIDLCAGAYFWLRTRIPQGSAWHVLWAIGMFPLLYVGIHLLNNMVKTLKQNLTYSRTGFVSFRRPQGWRKWFSIRGAIFGAGWALVYGFLRSDAFPSVNTAAWIPLVTGLIFAGAFIWAGMKTGIFRLLVTAVISALAGVGLFLAGLPEMAALGAFWGILGVSFCLSGAFALLRYLRRHPSSGADPS